jgi:HD superfamily phosphohydrolase
MFRFLFAIMVDYLSSKDEPTEYVRCPVHGFIHYSPNEREIIDHRAFQRLREIRQLALCLYVYPGATHTRFEHSLGVMEMATRAFEIVALKHREQIVEELSEIPELREGTLAKSRQVLRLLALLHDVGHPAFSHATEDALPAKKHEAVSVYVIRDVLGKKLNNLFFEGAAELVVRILEKSPELIFLRQFVVGEIDMDRTDYLIRDSLHCGVEYGRFDFRQLLESLTVFRNPDTGRLELALERGGEHAFEALIWARYQMNTQVYLHKVRRIYDEYLRRYVQSRFPEGYKDNDEVLKYNDQNLLVQVANDAVSDKYPIAKRIAERKHHKVVFRTGDSADAFELKKVKRVFTVLKERFKDPDPDFFFDNAEGTIHNLTVPGDHEESKVEDFFIVEKGGRTKLLTDDSAILKKIPKKFRAVRIYADGSPELLKEIGAAAAEESQKA